MLTQHDMFILFTNMTLNRQKIIQCNCYHSKIYLYTWIKVSNDVVIIRKPGLKCQMTSLQFKTRTSNVVTENNIVSHLNCNIQLTAFVQMCGLTYVLSHFPICPNAYIQNGFNEDSKKNALYIVRQVMQSVEF